jgi:hypothetical protein
LQGDQGKDHRVVQEQLLNLNLNLQNWLQATKINQKDKRNIILMINVQKACSTVKKD